MAGEDEDVPTPPEGTPVVSLAPRDGTTGKRVARRVAPVTTGERHEKLLLEMVEKIEARLNRRSGK